MERGVPISTLHRAVWRHFDIALFLVTLALVLIGGVMIYSAHEASLPAGDQAPLENAVYRQVLFAGMGLVLYLAGASVDYRVLYSLSRWVYLCVVIALGATLTVGSVSFGARSWLAFQTFDVQPSELAKVLMIVVLARSLSSDQESLESARPLLVSIVLVVLPFLLIYLQPDFGTALILLVTWAGMAFLAGVRWRHMFLLGCIVAIAAPLAWSRLEGYMRERVVMFFFPGEDRSGASYNVTQALISIGSGGVWGKGLLQGTQSQLHFLRVRHTDFIFSVLAEELGFVGSMLFLSLFAFLILRLVRIAAMAEDGFGRLIVAGVAVMLLAQALIHLGMNANLLPVTGLPLPLVSYGGSSLVTTLLALGLAQSVAIRQKNSEQSLL